MFFLLGFTLLVVGTTALLAGGLVVEQAEDKRQLLGGGGLGVFLGVLVVWWGVYHRWYSGPEVILAKEGLKLPTAGTGIIPWACIDRAEAQPSMFPCCSSQA